MLDLPLIIATAAEGEEEGGSFLVSPDVGLMIWTLLVFGLSLYLLNKLAFPRIAEALDRRQRAIEESIDAAERTRREADELLGEYRERLTAARQQADDIVARARKAGEQHTSKRTDADNQEDPSDGCNDVPGPEESHGLKPRAWAAGRRGEPSEPCAGASLYTTSNHCVYTTNGLT
jgi:hypothetical protein